MKTSLFAAMLVATSTAALSQDNLRPSHLVYMNPFLVQKYQQQAIDEGYVPPQIPAAVKEEAKFPYIAKHFDEFKYSPGVEILKQEISRKYGLNTVFETAGTMPAFYANLSEDELRNLNKAQEIVTIYTMDTAEDSLVFSASNDYISNGEIVPWGKQQVLSDDNITSSINFYIVDTVFSNANSGNEINLLYTNNGGTPQDHASSVLSIAAAIKNSTKIRGINPGQPVVHYGSSAYTASANDAIALISSMSEWANQFSTLNISFNHNHKRFPQSNSFAHTDALGRVVRRASGRLMVAQSAGNFNIDACRVAFGYGASAGTNDGILVVGGTDKYDYRYSAVTNPTPYYDPNNPEDRSNYGPCVEVWAPGQFMTTTIGDGSVNSYTGTSFSAPVVAALAGRYGDMTTRPIEREAYIKEAADWTGHYEDSPFNLPIYRAKYSPPYWHNIPKRLPVTGVYSISSTTNLNKLVDEKFYDGIDWNAGGGWGSIVIDLGSAKNLTGVRVMIRSSASGGTLNFAVHGGNTINVTAPGVATIPNNPVAYQSSNDQFDLVPYYIPITGNYRYVMLEASNAASWLSYSEVEVYGR